MLLVLWQKQKVQSPPSLGETRPSHHLFKIKILPSAKEGFELPHCSSGLLSQTEVEEEEDDMTAKPSFHSREKSPDSSPGVELQGRGSESGDRVPALVLSLAL